MKLKLIGILILLFVAKTYAQREASLLDQNWKFIKGDVKNGASSVLDDRSWKTVAVPHDWAIAGPFDQASDAQNIKITEDGEKKASIHTGRTGSLPYTGVGWYRKEIFVPLSKKGHRCFIELDGAMSHAQVFLNGKLVGNWPFGYASFSFELTSKVRFGEKNILAVRLENFKSSSRWYPGAGIYRNVRWVYTSPVHVAHWGTYITTPLVTLEKAEVQVKTTILNQTAHLQSGYLITDLLDPSGNRIDHQETPFNAQVNEHDVLQKFNINQPKYWDTSNPLLYKAISKIQLNHQVVDTYETSFGVRTIAFDANKGFILNGKQVKIKGVCNHQDLGPLGDAVNVRALERQLELLKAMGANAIRTSHNPPAPELLDLCDKMGFLVMDEAFDEWRMGKVKNGYHTLFNEWAKNDLEAMIHRDRNHPSVILWSIGNEVKEQKDSVNGAKTAKFLVDIAHQEDPTRLTTSAFNSISSAIKNGLAEVVDVVGFNYWPENYAKIHLQHPDWKLLGSETQSTVSSRGVYMFPMVERKSFRYANKQCSSYDMEMPSWGSSPDVEFKIQNAEEYVAGQFVWTGFDYLGEPTPYTNDYPSHSSYFGIIDLAGIPKDRYYLYQSAWTNKKVLHILPHWTWPGRAGEITPVQVYTNYPSAELFVNGKSMGIQRKNPASKYGAYRLIWDQVIYEPGEIKVLAFNDEGKVADTAWVKTAGKPYQIKLEPDRSELKANGKDLSYLTVSVLDKNGVLCPTATNDISFKVSGVGWIRGVANGDPTSLQNLTGHEMQVFSGKCVLVIQSSFLKGDIEVIATSLGLKKKSVHLIAR